MPELGLDTALADKLARVALNEKAVPSRISISIIVVRAVTTSGTR